MRLVSLQRPAQLSGPSSPEAQPPTGLSHLLRSLSEHTGKCCGPPLGWGVGMRPARGFSSLICEMVLPTHVLCPSCQPMVGRS